MRTLIVFALIFMCCPIALGEEIRGKDGFWRLVKDDSAVWWFESPDGQRTFLKGVNTVQPIQGSRDPSGPHYYSSDFRGDENEWAKKTASKLENMGFVAAAWSHPALLPHIPMTQDLNLWRSCTKSIDSPEFEVEMERLVSEKVSKLKDNKNLIGYYLDNELDWQVCESKAEKYFETTHRLVRKYDPNHLILGVRFNHRPPQSVIRASKGRVDAHSINSYKNDGRVSKEYFRELHNISDAPIIISEFSFYSNENQSGNKNIQGFGGKVQNQEERAKHYAFFVAGMASASFVVGCEWFQWNDQPPKGRFDGEDMNFGIVDIHDKFYDNLAKVMRETNEQTDYWHSLSDDKQKHEVWKDGFQ